ncbi:probable LRR receptor-like serine/threonine-protein kinase At4g37250 [Cornus florida]|uniref:probable LRR receptor-like serine/threonine-protein kinase At4g37250 n=1 Tax=Cornus florida TaxID=4283 RepID=UPI00289C702E|nr:probable LRR receptor-like serine/threonine-protein kinase At4g37250 [Cornus florida]
MSFTRTDSLHFLWPFLTLFVLFLSGSSALNTDGTLLLSFKYSLLSDPVSVLGNWDYYDDTPCSWTGVTCAEIGNLFGTPDMFRVISLVLPNSQLLGSIPEDLGMIQHLRTLDLSNNFLNGTLPASLFNASDLQVLSLSNNMIYGELPELTGGLGLQFINLSSNALAGKVPKNLTSLKNLTVVSLRSNYFSGYIPRGFDFAEVLDLSSNMFNGSLAVDFGGQSLRYLNLSYNKLSGSISPQSVKNIPANATVDLSFNNLTGEIPQSMALGNQKAEFFAGNTDLCGKPLKKLCIIPSTLSTPPNVTTNNTSPAIAVIPRTVDSTPVTNSPNGSPNSPNQQQRGLNPGTIAGIAVGDLAGIGILAMIFLYVYQLKKKKKRNETEKSVSTVNTAKKEEKGSREDPSMTKDSKALVTWPCLRITNGEETSEANTGSDSDDNKGNNCNDFVVIDCEREEEKGKRDKSLVMVDGETELELETLLKASAYILGSNGPSIVYKAVLENGTTAFAVRRIGKSGGERLREFENRVRGIAKLRHPNLVRIRGFYWGEDEKLVIYDYVSNGSLASAGYKKMGSSPCHLPLEVRLKIARGVARGLTYIHEKKHAHGNVKPSNILLTPDMEPIISDLGLDRLVLGDKKNNKLGDGSTRHFGSKRSIDSTPPSQDHLRTGSATSPYTSPYTVTAGYVGCTSPYHAPESLKNLKPNPKWDVYSFGIVLLELLTGRVFSDRELGQWTAGSAVDDRNRVLRMADVAIRGDVEGRSDAMLACFKLGFSCASLVPQKRPSMKEALQVLEKIPCSSRQ